VLLACNVFGANGFLPRWVGSTSTFYTFDPQGNVCQRFDLARTVLSPDTYGAFGGTVRPTHSDTSDVFGFGN